MLAPSTTYHMIKTLLQSDRIFLYVILMQKKGMYQNECLVRAFFYTGTKESKYQQNSGGKALILNFRGTFKALLCFMSFKKHFLEILCNIQQRTKNHLILVFRKFGKVRSRENPVQSSKDFDHCRHKC